MEHLGFQDLNFKDFLLSYIFLSRTVLRLSANGWPHYSRPLDQNQSLLDLVSLFIGYTG